MNTGLPLCILKCCHGAMIQLPKENLEFLRKPIGDLPMADRSLMWMLAPEFWVTIKRMFPGKARLGIHMARCC